MKSLNQLLIDLYQVEPPPRRGSTLGLNRGNKKTPKEAFPPYLTLLAGRIHHISHLVIQTLASNLDSVDKAVQLLATWMREQEEVRVIGAGRALLAGSMPGNRLAHAGVRISFMGGMVPLPNSRERGGIIAGSASGKTEAVLQAMEIAKHLNPNIITLGIAARNAEKFESLCDVFIGIEARPSSYPNPLSALADIEEYVISEILDGLVVLAGKALGFDDDAWRNGHEDIGPTGPYSVLDNEPPTLIRVADSYDEIDLIRYYDILLKSFYEHRMKQRNPQERVNLKGENLPAKPSHADAFDQLFADLPSDFDACSRTLAFTNSAFRNQIASTYEPILNKHLRAADPQDVDAKKQLASQVMERLDALGLAIRCPKTGQPSALMAKQNASNPKGQFFITPKGTNRPSFIRTKLSNLLPLNLVVDRPRREALDEWRAQAGQQGSPHETDHHERAIELPLPRTGHTLIVELASLWDQYRTISPKTFVAQFQSLLDRLYIERNLGNPIDNDAAVKWINKISKKSRVDLIYNSEVVRARFTDTGPEGYFDLREAAGKGPTLKGTGSTSFHQLSARPRTLRTPS